jgi:signal transduction histidine kinase
MTTDEQRLLVVEDEENVGLTLGEVLRREGYWVDVAITGKHALELLHQQSYDLVLTDLHMEGLDGRSVLKELRRNHPRTIAIVLTGFASLESAVASMRQGAYDYLIKPCIIDDLKATVKRGLEHRRLLVAEQESRRKLEDLNLHLQRLISDQTEHLRRANEQLRRQDTAKDIFLAIVSHELRTPLTPITGWARVLAKDPKHPALVKGLLAIEKNALQQARVVEDLLDISKIITGKLMFQAVLLNANSAVVATVESMRDKAAARGLTLAIDVPARPVQIRADEMRLVQIVSNLLSNAIKFTHPGGTIAVAVKECDEFAHIVVSDNGVGIEPGFLPHIFEMFKQAEWFRTRKHDGLGLGLSIVQRLVELHGGHVKAESAGVGTGSTFRVSLPSAQQQRVSTYAGERASAATNKPL